MKKIYIILLTMLSCVVSVQAFGVNRTSTNNDESVKYTILDSSGGFSGEQAANLFDGDSSTKWCVSFSKKREGETTSGAFVIFKASFSVIPTHYTLTTANDTQGSGRNWKQWQLYGMNADSDNDVKRESGNWVPLDKKYNIGSDQLPDANYTSAEFSLSEGNTTPYRYFKIEIDEIVGASCTQMADFLLDAIFAYIPFTDANVKAICISNWDTDKDGELSIREATAVTTLGEVFKNNNSITSFKELQFFTGLSTINDNAFNGCSSLTSVTLPKSVTSIGNHAFDGCSSLTSITLPESVTSIGDYAFNGCGYINSITFPESLTSIGQSAFGGWASLTTITIPESVTTIGEDAFNGCSELISVKVKNPTPVVITQNTFSNCTDAILYVPSGGSKAAYLAADHWREFKEIIAMDDAISFADENVKAICVSNWDTNGDGELSYAEAAAITSIGQAFYNNTSITSFDELQYFIGMKTIGSYAFYGCSSLSSIVIPNSVTSISINAFDNLTPSFNWDSASKSLAITANKCATIYYSLDGSEPTVNSTQYTEPIAINRNLIVKAVAVISGHLNSDIASYTITNVDSKFFVRDYGLYFRLIDNTTENAVEVTSSDNYTGDITIPSSVEQDGITYFVTRIGNNAFQSRPITSVVLPNTIESIGQSAFYYCNQLTSINIPNSVKIIENNAFYGCRILSKIDIPSRVVQIGDGAFSYCSSIKKLQLPESLTDIGTEAFNGCISLSSITLPSAITTIPSSLFRETGLVSIELPNSVKTICNNAFSNCNQLASVMIPEGVEKIERSAFYNCNALTSLVLPSTLTNMEYYAFYNCSSLPTVTLPENLSTMGSSIFENCSSLTSIYCLATTPPAMPDGHAFKGLTSTATLFVNANVVETYKKANYWAEFSNISSFDQTPCAQPTFNFSNYVLTISSLMQGATLYYTTDGSEPTTNSTPYTAPIPFTKNGTVRAIAVCEGHDNSVISTFDKNDLKVTAPEATISEDYVVTLTCPDIPNDIEGFPETQLYYTVNRSSWQWDADDSEWKLYEGPIQLTGASWIHVIAKRDGWIDSDQQNFDYYSEYVKDNITFTIDNIRYTHDGASYDNTVNVTGHSFEGENGTIDIVIPEQVTNEGTSYTVTSIADYAFSGLKATRSVKLPTSIKTIGREAFYDNYYLEEFEFNEGLETIGRHAFGYNWCLHTIYLPTTLRTIGDIAFNSCGQNSSDENQMIIIHANVTNIGKGAFQNCSKVTSVFCYATNLPETKEGNPFNGTANHATLYVPASSINNYQEADYWKEFSDIQGFENIACEPPTFIYKDYKLTMSSRTNGATIYYTRDNTDPTTESLRYDGPIPLLQNDTIRAIAVLEGYDHSLTREFRKNDFKVSNPEATISEDYVVTLNCLAPDIDGFPETQLYYTLNRSSWQWNSDNSDWKLYEGPIQLTGASWVHVIAKRDGWIDSDQQNFDYYNEYVKENITFTIDNIKFTHDGGSFTNEVSVSGHTLEGGDGTIDIVIPESVTYKDISYTVTSIAENAFSSCSSLSSITIPSSVTSIGDWAFYNCSSLSSVTIPTSVTIIKYWTFQYCNNLNDVKVIVMDSSEFCQNNILGAINKPIQLFDSEGDEITEYIIPDGVTTIGESAFQNCIDLTSIAIPNSVTSIGDYAFQGCSGLTSVSIPKSVTVIGNWSFRNCSNLTSVKMGKNVNSIGDCAFSDCSSLTSITLPDVLENIGSGAFQATGLTSISIPGNVKTIGNSAFNSCGSLVSVNIEDGVTSIGSSAFYRCAFTSITIPNSVTSIEESAFESCNNLTTAILGDGITEIAARTFIYCRNLSSVIIPEGVTSIGEQAFRDCYKLTSIKLPESLTTMKDGAFMYCGQLKSIELPNSFTVIPDDLFKTNNFQYIKLGNNVKSIGKNAFGSSEPVIEIGTSTPPKIDKDAFPNVSYLADLNVIVPDTKAENAYRKAAIWKEMTFSNLNNNAEVTVEQEGDLSYELILQCNMQPAKVVNLKVNGTINADDFNQMLVNMKSLLRLDLSDCEITEIPDNALNGKTQLQELTLPATLQTLGNNAFRGCTYLTGELELPSTLTSIGEYAFVGTAYTSVKLPSTLKTIGNYAFNNLPLQQRLLLPNKMNSVGAYAFEGTQINGLVIPDGVKSIGDYAFAETPIQGHVTIPDGVTTLGQGAFRNTQISTVFLPNSITTLSYGLFQGCQNLNTVYVPDNFTGMDNYAFDGCGALTILRLSANTTSMGEYTFQSTPLEYIKVPSQVEVLSRGVFKNCKQLESLSLPASLKSLESEALYGCTALRNMSVEATTPPTIKDKSVMRGINTDKCLISIPTSAYRSYVLAEYWGQFVQMRNDIAVETEGDGEIAFESVEEEEDEEEVVETKRRTLHSARRAPELATDEESMTFANNGSSIYIPKQGKVRFYIIPAEGEELLSATLDGEDIMPYIVDGVYVATADKKNAKLIVKFSGTGQGDVILDGDVNNDGAIDVADIVAMINAILGKPSSDYHAEVADINGDQEVDVFDVMKAINLLFDQNNAPRRLARTTKNSEEQAHVTTTTNDVILGVDDANRFTAFQFDVDVSDGMELTDARLTTNETGHLLRFIKSGQNTYKVVGLSMNNSTFSVKGNDLVTLSFSKGGNVQFNNIIFVTPEESKVYFSSSEAVVTDIINMMAKQQSEEVFDLSGRKVNTDRNHLPKGVYIINNKKVIVK